MIMDMDIPLAKTGDNRVHILDVAKALTKRVAESRFQVCTISCLVNEQQQRQIYIHHLHNFVQYVYTRLRPS